MADPHIQSPMDFGDYLTVIIYRCRFCAGNANAVFVALLHISSSTWLIGSWYNASILAAFVR